MSETQRAIGIIDKTFTESTCIDGEKIQQGIGVIDKQTVETTCISGGQMSFRETQWDIARGGYKQFVVQLENSDDISVARDINMVVKAHFADDDTDIILMRPFSKNLSDLTTGKIVFEFEPDDTKTLEPMTYWFDIWLYLTTKEQFQIVIGQLNIRRNVWRR